MFIFPLLEETDPPKILLRPLSRSVLPIFYSRSFMVSGLTLKSLICFVYFCMKFGKIVQFDYFVVIQFSQHHLLKRLSFLHCIFLPPLS